MTRLVDLGIGIGASAAWSMLTLAGARVVTLFKTKGQRRFWKPFLGSEQPLSIVLTDKPGSHPGSPRKISLTDVQGYAELRGELARIGVSVALRTRSEATISQLENGAFISLGGPKANGVTEAVLARLDCRLPVTYDSHTTSFDYRGAKLNALYDQEGLIKRDYGLVVRLYGGDHSSSKLPILVAFGLRGHGTKQAVRAIINDTSLLKQTTLYIKKDFFALLEFSFSRQVCTSCNVVGVNEIPRRP